MIGDELINGNELEIKNQEDKENEKARVFDFAKKFYEIYGEMMSKLSKE